MKIVGLSSFHGLKWKKTVKFSLFKSHHGKAIDFLTGYEFKFFSKKKKNLIITSPWVGGKLSIVN